MTNARKWSSPREWLAHRIQNDEGTDLYDVAYAMAGRLDNEAIENLFSDAMKEEGYYEEAAPDNEAHTSGPWMLDTSDSPIYVQASNESDSRIIAVVPIAAEVTPYVGMGAKKAYANAALIGAAPDMLGALRQLVAWGEKTGGWDAGCWKHAQDAIVKAERQSGA